MQRKFFIFISFLSFSTQDRIVHLDVKHYRQADDVDNHYYFAPPNDTKSCTRECIRGDRRVCYYEFVVENYAILTAACKNCTTKEEDCYLKQCVAADGFEKGILTVNRMLPGPGIQVCYGDIIILDVRNIMLGRSLAFHWHGIEQRNRCYMDGVPFINQCPILDDTSFRYAFVADTAGTMYWHAHSAVHKLNGLQGTMIVREPRKKDPNSHLYDYDLPAHVLFILDWYHTDAEARIPGLIDQESTQDTTFYLINGKGRYTMENGTETTTPYHVFHVEPGFRYRFRVISAVCTQCPARLRIEGHKLLVISTSVGSIKPVLVDQIEVYSGERYDFVLNASEEIKTYWIEVRGMDNCFRKDICQLAYLNYKGSEKKIPVSDRPRLPIFPLKAKVLNPRNAACGKGDNGVCVSQLVSLKKVPKKIFDDYPDYNFEFTFGFHRPSVEELFQSGNYDRYLQVLPNSTLMPWMNNIQQLMPPSPLISQYEDIPKHMFCPNGTDGTPVCPHNKEVCVCVPIVRIRLGALVQIVLVDKSEQGDLNHPYHLHGHSFHVMSMGYVPKHLMNAKDINELLKNKKLPVSRAPAYKDVVAVPENGYTVIRFIADNPGFWFFHCHFVFHHVAGMGTILQIGEPSDFPVVPTGFPKCGLYRPPIALRFKNKHRKQQSIFY